MNSSLKRKRTTISLCEKALIIEASKKKSTTELAEEFGHPRTTIGTILKNKDKILRAVEDGATRKRSNIKGAKNMDLEELLLLWLAQTRSENAVVNGPMLKEKAVTFAKVLDIDDFVASDGWLGNFKRRNGIVFKESQSEIIPPKHS